MENEKPTIYPEWATDAGADIVEPSLGQKQIGWQPDDEPPAGWLNWWKNNVYVWLKHLHEVSSMWAFNWAYQTVSDSPNNFRCVGANDTYVAFGTDDGYIRYTADFLSWSTVSVSVGNTVTKLHYTNGYWVALVETGSQVLLYYCQGPSPAGTWAPNTSWSSSATGQSHLLYFNKMYWVVDGRVLSGNVRIFYLLVSTDEAPSGTFTLNSLTSNITKSAIKYSEEEDVWVTTNLLGGIAVRDSDPTGDFTGASSVSGIPYDIERLVVDSAPIWIAIGDSNKIFTAPSLSGPWTERISHADASSTLYRIVVGNGIACIISYVASGSNGPGASIQISRDGINYIKANIDSALISDLVYGMGRFIAMVYDDDGNYLVSLAHGHFL